MLKNLAIRLGINALALWAAAQLIGGMELSGGIVSVLGVAFVFGLVNAFLKPIARLLSFPLIVVTLGLFTLVVNAAMLGITELVTDGLAIDGAGPTIWGALVISLVSWPLSMLLRGDDG